MNEQEIDRLALAGNALRPDWPTASLRTFLTKNFAARAYRDVALVLANVCTIEPRTDTPKLMLQPSVWGVAAIAGGQSDAARHPAAVPFAELCDICGRDPQACKAMDNGHDYRPRAPHKREAVYRHGRALVDAALAAAPPPAETEESETA